MLFESLVQEKTLGIHIVKNKYIMIIFYFFSIMIVILYYNINIKSLLNHFENSSLYLYSRRIYKIKYFLQQF